MFWFLPSSKALRETHIRVYGTDRNLSALRRRCLMVLVCFQVVDLKLIYSMGPYRFRDMIVAMSMSRQSVVYIMHSCSISFCLKVVMQVALASEVILLLRRPDFRIKLSTFAALPINVSYGVQGTTRIKCLHKLAFKIKIISVPVKRAAPHMISQMVDGGRDRSQTKPIPGCSCLDT